MNPVLALAQRGLGRRNESRMPMLASTSPNQTSSPHSTPARRWQLPIRLLSCPYDSSPPPKEAQRGRNRSADCGGSRRSRSIAQDRALADRNRRILSLHGAASTENR